MDQGGRMRRRRRALGTESVRGMVRHTRPNLLAEIGTGGHAGMPVIEMSSRRPLPAPLPDRVLPVRAAMVPNSPTATAEPHGLWLDGHALMCRCPDCHAPLSVRVWLMAADCWRCGTSIELTEEQEQEARRLLAEQKRETGRGGLPAPATRSVVPSPHHSATRSPDRPWRLPLAEPPLPTPQTAPVGVPTVSAARPAAQPARRQAPEAVRRCVRWLQDLPAWLASLLFHLLLLTLLGLLRIGDTGEEPYITVSMSVSRDVREGGDWLAVDPRSELVFDLPVPEELDLLDENVREAVLRADADASELRIDPTSRDPYLPDLQVVRQRVVTTAGIPSTLAVRDPRIRVEVVREEGGTTLTEAAVSRGLRWLSRHQESDGRWSLHRFHHSPQCTCTGGGMRSDSAATSLALLPYLGAGQTHLVGHYRETVAQGLRWLLAEQAENGDLRGDSEGSSGMYAHGQGAIVLCEAYLMTGDELFRDPAQRAIDFIVKAQHAAGGWRYHPGDRGDTSVLGWQLMALQSARAAGLQVPVESFESAGRYLDTVAHENGARYAYQPRVKPTHVMTAEALLCRLYMGWNLRSPGVMAGAEYLVEQHPPERRKPDFYYWYYASQTLHHIGGPTWETWNRQLRDTLVSMQQRRGHQAGSWDPVGPHGSAGGRIYSTSLAICTLEVYYRHLPIFRQLRLE